jgi:hypothetical protein
LAAVARGNFCNHGVSNVVGREMTIGVGETLTESGLQARSSLLFRSRTVFPCDAFITIVQQTVSSKIPLAQDATDSPA